jgi:hypothetical protein
MIRAVRGSLVLGLTLTLASACGAQPTTATSEATATPEPTATAAPEATATPEPAATAAPEATATPEPTATAAPEATATPEPTATREAAVPSEARREVRGQVLEVVGRNPIEVELLRVRDEAGKEWTFATEGYAGVTPDHLREHQLFRQPVLVLYVVRGDMLVALIIADSD